MSISTGQFCDNIPLSPWQNAAEKAGSLQQLPAADVLNSNAFMALVYYPFSVLTITHLSLFPQGDDSKYYGKGTQNDQNKIQPLFH